MPKAFSNAGWMVAIVLTGVLCFMRLVPFSRTSSVSFVFCVLLLYVHTRIPIVLACLQSNVNSSHAKG